MKNLLLMSALLLASFGAAAQNTKSSTLTNTVNSVSACTIVTTQQLTFNGFNPLAPSDVLGQASVSVNCTPGTFAISTGKGRNDTNIDYNSRDCGRWGCTYDVGCLRNMVDATGRSRVYYDLYTSEDPSSISLLIGPSGSGGVYQPPTCGNTGAFTRLFKQVTFTQPGAQTVNIYGRIKASSSMNALPGVHTDAFPIVINF